MRQKIIDTYYRDYQEKYTQQTAINEYLKIWKANANAVDLNRNFDALWSSVNTGMPRPSHKNYKGTAAESEPETRAMVELTESIPNIQAVLCIHSQGEVLYWDCGQTGALREDTRDFAEAIGFENGYRVIYEQHNDASYSDWCALNRGLIAVTVETGVDACPLPISQFPQIWNDNFDLFAFSAAHFSVED
jgi:g-D-glutamyl-meso-diaminopimelate peptidase